MMTLFKRVIGMVKFKAVPQGTVLALFVKRVKATGTTATDLVAIW